MARPSLVQVVATRKYLPVCVYFRVHVGEQIEARDSETILIERLKSSSMVYLIFFLLFFITRSPRKRKECCNYVGFNYVGKITFCISSCLIIRHNYYHVDSQMQLVTCRNRKQ